MTKTGLLGNVPLPVQMVEMGEERKTLALQ